MNLHQPRYFKLSLASFCLGLFVLTALPAHATDKKEVIRQARASYYSLRSLGLVDFQASIRPNWERVLKNELQANPEGAREALKLLYGIHFSVFLDSAGKVKVDHVTDTPPPNEKAAAGFQQIYSGMDQAITGFFDSWSPFVLTNPFPDVESAYTLDDLGSEYRLAYKEGASDVVTKMTKDLVITSVTVTSPEYASSFWPKFNRNPKGLVLASYSADYQPTSGKGVVKLKVDLEYHEVNGLQLPSKLSLDSVYDGAPTQMELTLDGYKVTTK